jgi:hypothetical protein
MPQKAGTMSTAPAPVATTSTSTSIFSKIWSWLKKSVSVVEADLAKIVGPDTAAKIEAAGKALLDGELGPLAAAAIVDATDVTNGTMSVSKAIDSLVTMAEADGKAISKAAALQVIALAQNALPIGSTSATTITPVA